MNSISGDKNIGSKSGTYRMIFWNFASDGASYVSNMCAMRMMSAILQQPNDYEFFMYLHIRANALSMFSLRLNCVICIYF